MKIGREIHTQIITSMTISDMVAAESKMNNLKHTMLRNKNLTSQKPRRVRSSQRNSAYMEIPTLPY